MTKTSRLIGAAVCLVLLGLGAPAAAQTPFVADVHTAASRTLQLRNAQIPGSGPTVTSGMLLLAFLDQPAAPGEAPRGWSGLSPADRTRASSMAQALANSITAATPPEVAGFAFLALNRYHESGGLTGPWFGNALAVGSALYGPASNMGLVSPVRRGAVEGIAAARAIHERLGNAAVVANIDTNLANIRLSLKASQHPSGGFRYSPGDPLPSHAGTADFLLAMLAAGVPPSDAAVERALGWLQLNYNSGVQNVFTPSWALYSAYVYASTKAFAILEAAHAQLAVMPADLGTLPPLPPTRYGNLDPQVVPRALAPNPAVPGFYAAEEASWWFDALYRAMSFQNSNGSFTFPGVPGPLGADGAQLYLLLTLQATRPCADGDADGVCDADDQCPAEPAGATPDPLRPGCPVNLPPVALCADRSVDADGACRGCAHVDAGSLDPEGAPLTQEQIPGCDYPRGATPVTLVVSDGHQESSCDATVTVHDVTAPVIDCGAPATATPRGLPACFTATAVDNCDAVTPTVVAAQCHRINGAGQRIDGTCTLRVDGASICLDEAGVGTHVEWTVQAYDVAGNIDEVTCSLAVVRPRGRQ